MSSKIKNQHNKRGTIGGCHNNTNQLHPMDVKQKMSNNDSATKKLTRKNCSNKPSSWEGYSFLGTCRSHVIIDPSPASCCFSNDFTLFRIAFQVFDRYTVIM